MNAGPLRRLLGALGLVALAPIGYLLATGALTPVDAAIRALVTLFVVVAVGRAATAWLGHVASSLESRRGEQQVRDVSVSGDRS